MHSNLVDIFIGVGVAVASFSVNAVLISISYAVAAMRFEVHASGEKSGLGKLEVGLVEKSKKLGSFSALGVRFFIIIIALSLFQSARSIFGFFDVDLPFIAEFCLAGLAIFLTLFIQYVFCDLPCSAFAARNPALILRRFAKVFIVFYYIAYPFEAFARYVSTKFFGAKINDEDASFDHIDVLVKLRAEEEDSDELTPYAKKIVRNSIRLNELEITDVMIPRNTVKFLDINDTLEQNLALARKYAHTRYPLCDDNLDNCLGIVHIKDLFREIENGGRIDFMKIKRGIMRVKHDDALIDTLSKLRRYELHMAFVEDEFGGIIGILTLEGIIAEIIGQIKEGNGAVDSDFIVRKAKNVFIVSGLASLHKVEDFLDVDFENDEVSTLGGLITQCLGRFPQVGEKILFPDQNLRVIVEKLSARRIIECKIELIS